MNGPHVQISRCRDVVQTPNLVVTGANQVDDRVAAGLCRRGFHLARALLSLTGGFPI
jgi:hypothetical protein